MLEGKKVEISTGGNFDPVPVDKYTVQCIDVNLITQTKFESSEEEEVLNYKFAILDDKPMEVTDGDGEKEKASTRGRYIWHRCRLVHSEQSWLGKLAIAVEGRSLTKEEIKDFDPESIVGKQLDILVAHKTSKERIFVNVVTFSKVVKPLEPMKEDELKKTGQVVEKTTAPATAPDAEADKLISKVGEEGAKQEKLPEETDTPDEEDVEVLELKLKLAKAKAKKAAKK